jgi:hypothetical protein
MAVALSLPTTLGGVISPTTAFAAGTVLVQNTFKISTVDGTGTVTPPTLTSGRNLACLTAAAHQLGGLRWQPDGRAHLNSMAGLVSWTTPLALQRIGGDGISQGATP